MKQQHIFLIRQAVRHGYLTNQDVPKCLELLSDSGEDLRENLHLLLGHGYLNPKQVRQLLGEAQAVTRHIQTDVRVGGLASGAVIGPFTIIELLGSGGMGSVYLARQQSPQRQVALKVMNKTGMKSNLLRKRFLKEAELNAQLCHPNIVQPYQAGIIDDVPYLAMEYVCGITLRQYLRENPEMSVEEKLRMVVSIAWALDYAHCHGVVHRDVKPDNILISNEGIPKLSDFGVAKSMRIYDKSLTKTGEVIGTPKYMAPEQLQGTKQIDGRVDIYALGSCLYELVTKTPPYFGESDLEIMYQVASGPPPLPGEIVPALAPAVEAIIIKAMASNKNRRYARAEELARDIENYLEHGRTQLSSRHLWEKWRWQLSRNKRLLPYLTLALLIIGIGGYLVAKYLPTKNQVPIPVARPTWVDYYAQINSLEQQQRYEEAAKACDQAIVRAQRDKSKEQIALRRRQAALYYQCGNYQKSYELYQKLNERESTSATLLGQAQAALAMENYAEARDLLQRIKLAVNDRLYLEWQIYRAASLLMNHISHYFSTIRLVEIQSDKSPLLFVTQPAKLSEPQQPAKLVELQQQATLLLQFVKAGTKKPTPLWRRACCYLGWAYLYDYRFRAKARVYLDAASDEATTLLQQEGLGIWHYYQKDYALALKYFDACINLVPWRSRYYHYRAQTRLLQPNFEVAAIMDDCMRTLQLAPRRLAPISTLYASILTKPAFENFTRVNIIACHLMWQLLQPLQPPELWQSESQKLRQRYFYRSQRRSKLKTMYTDRPRLLAKIVEQLCCHNYSMLDWIADLWDDSDMRQKVSAAIAGQGLSPQAQQELRTKIERHYRCQQLQDYLARFFSARDPAIFSAIGDERDIELLAEILENKDNYWLLRYWAAQMLRHLRNPDAYRQLIRIGTNNDLASEALAAAALLPPIIPEGPESEVIKLQIPIKSIATLRQAIDPGIDYRLPSQLIDIDSLKRLKPQLLTTLLHNSGGKLPEPVYQFFLQQKNSGDDRVRAAAARGILQMRGFSTKAIAVLSDCLASRNNEVKIYAALFLGQYLGAQFVQNKEVIPPIKRLAALFDTESGNTRLAAAWIVARMLIDAVQYHQKDWHRKLRCSLENLINKKQKQDAAIQLPIYLMLQTVNFDVERIRQSKNFTQLMLLGHLLLMFMEQKTEALKLSPSLLPSLLTIMENCDLEALALYFWILPEVARLPGPGPLMVMIPLRNFEQALHSPNKLRRMLAAQSAVRMPLRVMLNLLRKNYAKEKDSQVKECLAGTIIFISLYLNEKYYHKSIEQMTVDHPRSAAYGYYRCFSHWNSDLPMNFDIQQWLGRFDMFTQWGRDNLYWQRLQRTVAAMSLPAFLLWGEKDAKKNLPRLDAAGQKALRCACPDFAEALLAQTRGQFTHLHRLARQCVKACQKAKMTAHDTNIARRFMVAAKIYRCWQKLEKACELAPQVARYRFETAFLLQNLGEYDRAYQCWQQAWARQQTEGGKLKAIYTLAAAQLEYHRGHFRKAAKLVEQLRQQNLNAADVWELQGRIHLARQEWQAAIRSFKRQHFAQPDRLISLLLLTQAYLQSGDSCYRGQIQQLMARYRKILDNHREQLSNEVYIRVLQLNNNPAGKISDARALDDTGKGPIIELFLRQADNARGEGLLEFLEANYQLRIVKTATNSQVLDRCLKGNELYSGYVVYYPLTPFTRKNLAHYFPEAFMVWLRQRRQLSLPLEVIGLSEY